MRAGRVRAALLVTGLGLLLGCADQMPLAQSTDSVELEVVPGEMIIRGGALGSTRRFHIFFVGFGERNSFIEAERRAIEASGSEMLVSRLRLRTFEGLVIPGLWLQALGAEGATDIPIIGWEVYSVVGVGIRLVPGG